MVAATTSAAAAAQHAWREAQLEHARRRHSTASSHDHHGYHNMADNDDLGEFGLGQSMRTSQHHEHEEPLLAGEEEEDEHHHHHHPFQYERQQQQQQQHSTTNGEHADGNFVFLKNVPWMPQREGWGVVPNLDLFFTVGNRKMLFKTWFHIIIACPYAILPFLTVLVQLLLSSWLLAYRWKECGGSSHTLLHAMVIHLPLCQGGLEQTTNLYRRNDLQ